MFGGKRAATALEPLGRIARLIGTLAPHDELCTIGRETAENPCLEHRPDFTAAIRVIDPGRVCPRSKKHDRRGKRILQVIAVDVGYLGGGEILGEVRPYVGVVMMRGTDRHQCAAEPSPIGGVPVERCGEVEREVMSEAPGR